MEKKKTKIRQNIHINLNHKKQTERFDDVEIE